MATEKISVFDMFKIGDLYATACLIGSCVQVLLERQGINEKITLGTCIFIVVSIRIVSKWKRIYLPEI